MNTLEFSISNNTVTHLGRNLYSTTPPALAELIANSYDAYATNVNILLSSTSISIIDNGKGLDFDEFRNKYAIIGSAKQKESPFNGLQERNPMGKKGIGKLAAFSLGNTYTVYSKTVTSDKWISFTLNYTDMINGDKCSVDVEEVDLPEEFSKYNAYKSGFIVKITNVRRNITANTKKNILVQLSRRFYINQVKDNFSLTIDNKKVNLDSNLYYDKIEYLIYFGYSSEEDLKKQFSNSKIIEPYTKDDNIKNYFKDKKIKGWIGTTIKPKDLKTEYGASFANIILLANGKIADEDILKTKSTARIANNYIVGEIFADELISNLEDPITSSRQGLDDSIIEVEELITNIDKIRTHVIERWDDIRQNNAVDNLPERIKNNISYKEWLNTLNSDQKRINNKLLNLLSSRLDDEVPIDNQVVDSMITSIAGVINNIETEDLISSFEKEENNNIQIKLLLKLMANIAKTEDLNHANLIKKRLAAITKLEQLMQETDSKEKIFEEHLSDNPWLINPYWNIDRNNPTETDYLKNQEFFKLDKGNDEFKRNFLDISIRVAEEKYPIIIELKKNTADGYAKVNFNMINEQITNYRQAMIQNIPELKSVKETEIKVIFILSENTGMSGTNQKIEFTERELQMLEISNIEILKYNKILSEAKKMYREHLRYQQGAKLYPLLHNEENK
ncbi:ATP-binding protein [uncultured Gemella sp.]|uniref:ATP-binding protein n=1 Tax=uncultured Gemella sp. TaxID=254352 RepID=UPI0028D1A5B9|nr:ATP-binding protein [uncultured Gemella sp.]